MAYATLLDLSLIRFFGWCDNLVEYEKQLETLLEKNIGKDHTSCVNLLCTEYKEIKNLRRKVDVTKQHECLNNCNQQNTQIYAKAMDHLATCLLVMFAATKGMLIQALCMNHDTTTKDQIRADDGVFTIITTCNFVYLY